MNRIAAIQEQGQSIWFDYIQRSLIWTGALHRMTVEDGLKGVTSNPSIFDKAISTTPDYRGALKASIRRGGSAKDVYERIAVRDIQLAADVLLSVYDQTDGRDGYVSLEVSPHLARDTKGTVTEALRLWDAVSRDNVMIKVPATEEGLSAIETLISRGINVNVTLLFAVERYEAVARAFMSGLEKRLSLGEDISRVHSVASFFVSRIDTLIDQKIEERLRTVTDAALRDRLTALVGKVAIANAKLAYASYQNMMKEERWQKLAKKGAHSQRLLWASTSTKNPKYRDVIYLEELIGPDTVNTVPEDTYRAFLDHGNVAATLTQNLDAANKVMSELSAVDLSMRAITDQLLDEGVDKFIASFDSLLKTVEERKRALEP